MKQEDWRALPFGEIRVEHHFPGRGDQTITVHVDGKPVAKLPVTKVAFEQSYGSALGHVTLTMTAGDVVILASRPKLPGHDDSPLDGDHAGPATTEPPIKKVQDV